MSDTMLSEMLRHITKETEGRVLAERARDHALVEAGRLREELSQARTVNHNLAEEAEARRETIEAMRAEREQLLKISQHRFNALKNLKDAAADFVTRVEHQPRSTKNLTSGEMAELEKRMGAAQRIFDGEMTA